MYIDAYTIQAMLGYLRLFADSATCLRGGLLASTANCSGVPQEIAC